MGLDTCLVVKKFILGHNFALKQDVPLKFARGSPFPLQPQWFTFNIVLKQDVPLKFAYTIFPSNHCGSTSILY